MITNTAKMKMLAKLLWDRRLEMINKEHRMIRDSEFAHYLGVSVASFNQWINGNRLPNYDNVIKLSMKLGPEVFDILGYDRVMVVTDHELMFVAEQWNLLSEESRKWVIALVKEKTDTEFNLQKS